MTMREEEANMEIDTIMVPLDGSDFSRRALPTAREVAGRERERPVLLRRPPEDG